MPPRVLPHPQQSRRYGLFALRESDREAFVLHLVSLDAEGRRRRFGAALSDSAVNRIARAIELDSWSLGLFIWGELKGCAQVLGADGSRHKELAISLSSDVRGRGWGRLMVNQVLSHAQVRGTEAVEIQYLTENEAMHRLARAYPGTSSSSAGERSKTVLLQEVEPWPPEHPLGLF